MFVVYALLTIGTVALIVVNVKQAFQESREYKERRDARLAARAAKKKGNRKGMTPLLCFLSLSLFSCTPYVKRNELHVTPEGTFFLEKCYYTKPFEHGKVPYKCLLICTSATRLPSSATVTESCQ